MKLFGFLKKGRGSAPCGKEESAERTFRHFTLLLKANHEALELMADLEEKASSRLPFDPQYLPRTVGLLAEEVKTLVVSLTAMNGEKYGDLPESYNRIHTEIEKRLERKGAELPAVGYTISLQEVSGPMFEQVGGKAAHLGEVIRTLGLPVPNGFVVPAKAYKHFLSHNHLTERILAQLIDPSRGGWESLKAAGEEIRGWVLESRIPEDMEDALRASAEKLSGGPNRSSGLALRSSAVMEDGHFSFAGQYATFLNILPQEVGRKYREIAASQFTTPALFYMKDKGLTAEEMAMAVLCQNLIPAKASGILFTTHWDRDHGEAVLVNGVLGLGKPAVEGILSPDLYVLDKVSGALVGQKISSKGFRVVCHPDGGVEQKPVPEALASRPCLEPEDLKTLWEWALILEGHFHHPQDVEWALDEEGKLYLLQTRSLRSMERPEKPAQVSSARVLIEGGAAASFGVGSGPVFLLRSEEDLHQFPPGSVLVAAHSSPKFVTVMDKAAAIITDIGSSAGHMAILAREFKIPALVDTRTATRVLTPGQEVTVDAYHTRVYDRRLEELLKNSPAKDALPPDTPSLRKLQEVLKLIVPLYLTEPRSPDFSARACRTFHDLTRFAHEKAMEEMFHLAEQGGPRRGVRISTPIPLNLYALDLGGCFVPKGPKSVLLPEDLQSIPFQALWRGITHPGVRWAGPVGINIKGLLSVMTQSTIRPPEDYGDRTLALVSKNYLNFNSRLGYHFATVDSYCGPNPTDNYITFMFQGGAADQTRRGRRAQFIGRVLERLGFEVMVKEDLVKAQFRKFPPSSIEEKLDSLGRLMGCARLLDMTMSEENVVDRYVQSFLSGEYSLGEQGG